jgi:archaellum component FlaG (FlaF/FlaG flagellin family)
MPSIVFSEGFITVSAIILATIFTAAVVTNLQQMSYIQVAMTQNMKEKLSTKVEIIFTTVSNDTVYVWIKNTGLNHIPHDLISRGDLYWGKKGGEEYIPFNSTTPPTWNYNAVNDVDGDGYWDPGETVLFTIYLGVAQSTGDYHAIYITYNGEKTEYSIAL